MKSSLNLLTMDEKKLKAFLEGMYYVYARRELVYPDPLYFLYNYDDIRDREVVGLIASSLAYGRVAQIMKSVERVLVCLGVRPRDYLLRNGDNVILPEDFKHRFTTASDMNNFLRNIAEVLKKYDSIETFFGECLKDSGGELLRGLDKFAEELSRGKTAGSFSLISAPKDGSACKRIFMYLRWLVRTDEVDPGGWSILKPSELIVPLDTHMYQISVKLGLTNRKSREIKSALEISSAFRHLNFYDPVKYDFSLTRLGIRKILGYLEL